jgi:hypothetical protein
MAVTTWNTVPNYDEWGNDTFWSCEDWMQWHKLLKGHFGEEKARYIWNTAYSKGTMGAAHWDCRTFNTAFRDYASKNKLETKASAGIFSPVIGITGGILDVVDGVGDFFSGVSKGLGKAGKVVKVGVPLVLVGVGIYYGVRAYQNLKNPELAMRRAAFRRSQRRQDMQAASNLAKPI